MTFEELRSLIEKYEALIPKGHPSAGEAEQIAPAFQVIRSKIAYSKMILEMKRNEYKSLRSICFRQAILSAAAGLGPKEKAPTAVEKEAFAKADPDYIEARQMEEDLDAKVSYLNTMLDYFNNLHVFYRQMANLVE